LAYPEWTIAIEYDGDVHRTRRAWVADHAKTQLLLDTGAARRRLVSRPRDAEMRQTQVPAGREPAFAHSRRAERCGVCGVIQ